MSSILSKIFNAQYIIVNDGHNALPQISRAYLSCLLENLCVLINSSHFLTASATWQPPFHFDAIDFTLFNTLFK